MRGSFFIRLVFQPYEVYFFQSNFSTKMFSSIILILIEPELWKNIFLKQRQDDERPNAEIIKCLSSLHFLQIWIFLMSFEKWLLKLGYFYQKATLERPRDGLKASKPMSHELSSSTFWAANLPILTKKLKLFSTLYDLFRTLEENFRKKWVSLI